MPTGLRVGRDAGGTGNRAREPERRSRKAVRDTLVARERGRCDLLELLPSLRHARLTSSMGSTVLREHLSALNAHFAEFGAAALFSAFKLDEETASFRISASGLSGEVSISLFERSGYPRTGGLAFAEGAEALVTAVEAIGGDLSDSASLDKCLRAL